MMSDSTTLTRCPHCQTRFRVTEQQLGVASGKVRCGNCMDVFNARDHAVPSSSAVASAQSATLQGRTPPKPAPVPAPAKPALPVSDDDEFLFQDDPEEDATDVRYTSSLKKDDDDFSDSFLSLDPSSSFGNSKDGVEPIGEVDESWAEAILQDDAHPATQVGPEEAPAGQAPSPAEPELRKTPDAALKATSSQPAEKDPAEELSLSVAPDDIRYAHREPGGTPIGGKALDKSRPPTESISAPTQSPYANLRHDPVAATDNSRGWGMTLLWGLGCILLLGFIASQLFYFQFDRLSRYPALQPLYAAVCPLIGCELPEMVDTDQIESRRLVVRSHPEEPRALLVEALIVNQAPFPQPFPAIVMTFSNLNNDVVAQRAFQPEEYLAGDAQELDRMPEGTPVKIALELRDPGQDAVNYSLRFLPTTR